jgi:hypothetical protein
MNPQFQIFLNNCATEATDRKRLKVLEQRGEIFQNAAKTRSAALGIQDISMCQNDKLKVMSNLINEFNSIFPYKTSIRE